MKKITLMLFIFSLFSTISYGQYLTEGFETAVPPAGWTLTQVNASETWQASTVFHTGAGAAEVNYDPALVAQDETLTTPVIDLSSATNPRLIFWVSMSYFWSIDPNENYDFTVSATDGTTETVIWQETDLGVFDNYTYIKVELNLAAYAGQSNVQILFNYSGLDGAALYLDDILVEETPTCPTPENSVVVPTQTTADVSWDAVAEATLGYEWVIMASGSAPDAGTAIDSGTTAAGVISDSASGLTEATDYDFYVRGNCDTNGLSNWSAVLSFRTLALEPNCAINPTPADGAIDVATGNVTFSWEAPTSGPTPTSYNLYAGETPSGDDYGLIGNFTDTNAAITLTGYDTLLYWIIKPVNETTEATGCPVWSFTTGSAPVGAICEDAIVVNTIPYNTTGDTSAYGNDYDNTDVPPLAGAQFANGTGSAFYITGDDVVYEFTPTSNGTYNFDLSETLDDWISFWLFEGCPFSSVVAYHTATSGTTRSLPAINLTAGTTYYVVISSWPSPQSTPYTLDITQLTCTGAIVESSSTNIDCTNNQYFIDVDISDIGDATEIFDGTNSYPITGTGITQAGPYAFGTTVDLTIVHSDTACNIDLGSFIVNGCPPVNDDCSGAIALTPGVVFTDNPVVGTNISATTSSGAPAPGCASYNGGDMWYSVVVPADGNITLEMNSNPTGGGGDAGAAAYSGTCGSLTLISCNDDDSDDGLYPIISISDPALAGQTIYLRVWEYGNDATINFQVSAYSATLSVEDFQNQNLFSYYPNPVTNSLTLKAQQNIQDVAVYNMLGQEVLRVTPNTVSSEMNMTSLQAGTYFVKVKVANTIETIRIIKN